MHLTVATFEAGVVVNILKVFAFSLHPELDLFHRMA